MPEGHIRPMWTKTLSFQSSENSNTKFEVNWVISFPANGMAQRASIGPIINSQNSPKKCLDQVWSEVID